MILSNKQLEELENLHNSVGDFDEESNISSDTEDFEDTSDGTLAWRRSMIERAVTTVKKIEKITSTSANDYKIGALVFDDVHNCYARITQNQNNEIELAYVSGGTGIFKESKIVKVKIDRIKQSSKTMVKNSKNNETKSKTFNKKTILKKIKIPEEIKNTATEEASKSIEQKKNSFLRNLKPEDEQNCENNKLSLKKKEILNNKITIKTILAKQYDPLCFLSIVNENFINVDEFIKKNYQKMNNEELSAIIHLPQHTIRKKVDKWNL